MLMTKKAIGTVAYLGGLPATLEAFTWAWGQMIAFNGEYLCAPGQIVHYDRASVSLHDFARNDLVNRMRGDWLIQMDTDHDPDPDIVARILWAADQHHIDVASAIYRHKIGPGTPVAYQWDEATQTFALPLADWDKEVTALRLGSTGGGCLFVRRSVFDRIRKEFHCGPFSRFDSYGEDHAFFQRCRKLEIPVYLLPRIESPHLAVKPQVMADFVLPTAWKAHRHETEGLILNGS